MNLNNIFKPILAAGVIAMSLTSCYEDKGNYEYSEIEQIHITFGQDEEGFTLLTTDVAAMRNAENIEIKPTVISSIAGEIDETNTDYEFNCKINYKPEGSNQAWYDIDSLRTKDVSFFANIPAGNYKFWYTVKNKNTGITRSAQGNVKIIITTIEGWMVVSNPGSDNRSRLDMIFTDSQGVERVATDLFEETSAAVYNTRSIVMNTSKTRYTDQIFLLSESGGYSVDNTYLQPKPINNIKVLDFMNVNTPGEVIAWAGIYNGYGGGNQSRVCVTTEYNAYGVHVFGANSGFEYPMNAEEVGGQPTYKVAPFIGTTQDRPGNSNCALFYDTTNKRFMGYDYSLDGVACRLLFPLNNPSNMLFDFKTGMDLVDMQSTKFSQGLVYSVLQDRSGHRHVYGINMAGEKSNKCFVQECAYDNITATDFDTATGYAFHSQFPLMFYCKDNKVYAYNLGINMLFNTINLDPSETVTKIKFNLFQSYPTWLIDQSQEFMQQQYNLIVASTTGEPDGGIVRFYQIKLSGEIELIKEFKGLGHNIVDVTYREQRS